MEPMRWREDWRRPMRLVRNAILTLLIVTLGVWALRMGVTSPVRQNQLVKSAMYANDRPRETAAALEQADHFDPYLRGWALLERARAFRVMSRDTEAVDSYRAALVNRVPPGVLVELGLYLIELRRHEEGKRELIRAARYSQRYLRMIPSRSLRATVKRSALPDEE